MTANRDRDAIVRAWIDAGPRQMPESARHAISTTAQTLPQRSRRSIWPAALLGVGTAVAVVAVAVVLTLPRPAPNANAVPGSIELGTVGGPITLSYRIPADLDITVEDTFARGREDGTPRAIIGFTEVGTGLYGFGVGSDTTDSIPPEERELPAGSRGVVVAEVTNLKTHGLRGQLLGTTPDDFVEGIAAYPVWTVRDVSATTIAGLPALEASVMTAPNDWAHLDTAEANGTRIELFHPSKLIVTTYEGTLLMVQVWAPSEGDLQAWLPTAMQLVDSFDFTAGAGD